MKAVILDGVRAGEDSTGPARMALLTLLGRAGWTTRSWVLREHDITYCQGCFECWVKTPGTCRAHDRAPEIAEALVASDLAVLLTPVTFGGYSSELKKALDRCICIVSPFFKRIAGETHHRKRYDRYPRLLGIGVLPAPDPEAEGIFAELLRRNAVNLHAPASSAGFAYAGEPAGDLHARFGPLLERLGASPAPTPGQGGAR